MTPSTQRALGAGKAWLGAGKSTQRFYAAEVIRDLIAEVERLAGLGQEQPSAPDSWPEREADLAWLECQQEGGHCGEGTSEAIQRGRINACVDRILAALSASPSVEGWVLVPKEPTEAMRTAGINAVEDSVYKYGMAINARAVWASMLAASPTPPEGDGK